MHQRAKDEKNEKEEEKPAVRADSFSGEDMKPEKEASSGEEGGGEVAQSSNGSEDDDGNGTFHDDWHTYKFTIFPRVMVEFVNLFKLSDDTVLYRGGLTISLSCDTEPAESYSHSHSAIIII